MCVINRGKFLTGILMLATIQFTVTFSVHLLEIVKEKAQNILPKMKSPITRELCNLKTVLSIWFQFKQNSMPKVHVIRVFVMIIANFDKTYIHILYERFICATLNSSHMLPQSNKHA